jgi:predicted signal transduction protein with EAL and GGDEF domain
MTIGRELRAAVRRPVLIDEVAVVVDASIGVARAPTHGTGLSTLLHCADVAMHRAKKAGGGVLGYDPDWAAEDAATAGDLPDLRRALAEDRLELRYREAPSAGMLAAVPHWRYSRHGLQPATDLLAAARYTPMMRSLTSWVLQTAATDCAAWRAAGHDVGVLVHLPAPAAEDPELPALLDEAAHATGLPRAALHPDFGSVPDDGVRALPASGIPALLAGHDRAVAPR